MKTLTEYIVELNPVYEFTVRLAGCDTKDNVKETVATALAMYVVEQIGTVKRLPVQEHADFPGMGACECHLIEVAVKYPVQSDQVRQAVAEKMGISPRQVVVRTKTEDAIHMASPAEPKKAKDGSVLSNPELEAESGQHLVGSQRIDSMLKELQTKKFDIAKGEVAKSVDLPMGEVSPVGSKQNKIPSPRG